MDGKRPPRPRSRCSGRSRARCVRRRCAGRRRRRPRPRAPPRKRRRGAMARSRSACRSSLDEPDGRRRAARSCARPPPAPRSRRSPPAASTMDDFLRSHFKELSTDELAKRARQGGEKNMERFGKKTTVTAEGPRPGRRVRLRARPLALHRLPPLRLRLRGGEQPVARTRRSTGSGCSRWTRSTASTSPTPTLLRRRTRCPRPGNFYMPVQCQQCRNPPCTKVVPDAGDVEGEGRHRRHRLRLVHRLPLLHGGLPVRRAPLQLGDAEPARGGAEPEPPRLPPPCAARRPRHQGESGPRPPRWRRPGRPGRPTPPAPEGDAEQVDRATRAPGRAPRPCAGGYSGPARIAAAERRAAAASARRRPAPARRPPAARRRAPASLSSARAGRPAGRRRP